MLIGSGYFSRAQDKDIRALNDLADLAAAGQWFRHLRQDEWVASVDLLIGLKTGHTVLEHVRDKYLLLQISRVHLHRARQYYAGQNLPEIQQRVEKESDWINDQLSNAINAAAQIEAAQINAQSRVQAAETIGNSINQLSLSVEQGLDALGNRIEAAGGRIAAALAWGAKYVGDSNREGLRGLGRELGQSIDRAGDKAANAMSGLGIKMALGMVGAGALHAFIMDGTLRDVADKVTPQIRQGLEHLKVIEPAAKTAQPVNAADIQDALLTQGIDEVNSRMRPFGLEVGRTSSRGGA
jgi:hypothetical protein